MRVRMAEAATGELPETPAGTTLIPAPEQAARALSTLIARICLKSFTALVLFF